jgi:pimeloyl-ACP methyl ester carboxylesterase
VAADGTTEVVIRIPTINTGDQFTLTLMNDQQPSSQSTSVAEDGALGIPGATSFTQPQITVTSQSTGNAISEAFAVYLAPVDFARPVGSGLYKSGSCGGTALSDDQSGCRTVSIQIQNQTSGAIANLQVRILRPPVMLIHGLWAGPSSWGNFAPFNVSISSDRRFFSGSVGYNTQVAIASSSPSLDPSVYPKVLGSSIGFQYNAPGVASGIDLFLQKFKNGQNPQAIPVAAIQGDIVAHSMGGDITRTLALQPDFLSPTNFGQGSIHKVVTIDTPHLGSPLATQLMSGQNNCTLSIFASLEKFSFVSVVLSNGFTKAGAVWDLQGDGLGGGMSADLADLANPLLAQHPLPTALIAAAADNSNLSGVDGSVAANLLRSMCLPSGDPLAVDLTTQSWPNVFSGGQPNDTVVPLNSQLNRISGNPPTIVAPGSLFTSPGYEHSRSLASLGFRGPSVLDAGAVPTQVVKLLNTPVTDPVFNKLNP